MLQNFLAMGAENSEKHSEALAVMASKQVSAFERQQDIQNSLQRQQTLSSAFGACSDPNQFQARMFQALVTGDSNQVFGASDSEDMSIGQRQSQLHPQMQRTLALPEGEPGTAGPKPTLIKMVNMIKSSLGLEGLPVEVVETACTQLGVTGGNLMDKASACCAQLV